MALIRIKELSIPKAFAAFCKKKNHLDKFSPAVI